MFFVSAQSIFLASLLAFAAPAYAVDASAPAAAADSTKAGNPAASSPKPGSTQTNKAKPKNKYASDPKQKVVDINSASKQELMKLPYIDDATADSIIAGRPFLSKAHLVTRKILGLGPYQVIAKRIIARQDTKKPKK
jgi:competence protein ComEA